MKYTIVSLNPYFFSLRNINTTTLSLDLKLPSNWVYTEPSLKYDTILNFKIQDRNPDYYLLSISSSFTEEEYLKILECAGEIVDYNKQKEEKDLLFKQKINELKYVFEEKSLDELKSINFEDFIKDGNKD